VKRIELGVNIDHVATLREVRKASYPDPVFAAFLAEQAGADQITVHLREDRRHIQERDVLLLKQTVQTRLNLEMAATKEMLTLATEYAPSTVTFVPERREELTTEGGLNAVHQLTLLAPIVQALKKKKISVMLFIDPDSTQINAAKQLSVDGVEFHTGKFSLTDSADKINQEYKRLHDAALLAHQLNLRIAAGHGLHYSNIHHIVDLPHLAEVNIGHAIIARAVTTGIGLAVKEMIECLR